jgi:replicative DNA helicase
MSKVKKLKKIGENTEKLILQGCIVDTLFLGIMEKALSSISLESPEISLCISWIYEYYHNSKKAPETYIREILQSNKETITTEEFEVLQAIVKNALYEYSDKEFNRTYIKEKAFQHLRKIGLKNSIEKANILLDRGEVDRAEELLKESKKEISENVSEIYDINKGEHTKLWWGKTETPDLKFNNALDSFLPPIQKGRYYGIYGRAKVGKSYHLMYWAQKAAEQKLKVLIFNLEMKLEEYHQRWAHMLLGKRIPTAMSGSLSEYSPIPLFDCVKNQKGTCKFTDNTIHIAEDGNLIGPWDSFKKHKVCTKCLDQERTKKHFQLTTWLKNHKVGIAQYSEVVQILKDFSLHTGSSSNVKMAPYLIGQATPEHVRNDLDILEESGWIPDMVVYDYPQIFKLDKRKERRIAIGEVHEALSSLAKQRNHIGVAGIQANRSGNTANRLSLDHLAEDISAAFTVDGILAVNSCDFDYGHFLETDRYWKRQRLEMLLCRYADIATNQQLLTLENRDLGQIFINGVLTNAKG